MMQPMEFSPEVERALVERFPSDAQARARAILESDQPDRVLLAVLALSDGDLQRLRHFSEAAASDSRDVLHWAENQRGQDEPSSYQELRDSLGSPPDA
ncbi:MAG: hypothetical protein ACRDPA_10095 [Solirubrobacteraceae bacterium]